jgi:putative methyltransferase (TIGR04325 family)
VDFDAAEQKRALGPGACRMYARDYPVLFWLATLLQEEVRIFDLGGSIGITYHAFQKYLQYPQRMRWTVCDQPGVTQVGQELSKVEPSAGLAFTTCFEDADGADVLLVAGALHYIERPLAVLLTALHKKPTHILLNKLPLSEGPDFVTLTRYPGGGIAPYHVFNRLAFIDSVSSQGYELVDNWSNPDVAMDIPFHPEKRIESFSGLYFRSIGTCVGNRIRTCRNAVNGNSSSG